MGDRAGHGRERERAGQHLVARLTPRVFSATNMVAPQELIATQYLRADVRRVLLLEQRRLGRTCRRSRRSGAAGRCASARPTRAMPASGIGSGWLRSLPNQRSSAARAGFRGRGRISHRVHSDRSVPQFERLVRKVLSQPHVAGARMAFHAFEPRDARRHLADFARGAAVQPLPGHGLDELADRQARPSSAPRLWSAGCGSARCTCRRRPRSSPRRETASRSWSGSPATSRGRCVITCRCSQA